MVGASDREIRKLMDIIKAMRTGILVTHDGPHLKGRPIQIAGIDANGTIWFYTYEPAGRLEDLGEDNKVFLSFSEPETDVYAVVSAKAFEEDDLEKLKPLQNLAVRALLPNGASAKNIILFRAEPLEAEFWDGRLGRIVILFKMFSNLLAGSQVKEDDHKKINECGYS